MSPGARTWLLDGVSLGGSAGPQASCGLRLTPAGGVKMLEGDAAIRQSIVVLLSTMPGERVMRPEYGCPLHRLMFAPNDATTAGLAIHYIHAALQRWEPRIDVVRLDAGAASAPLAPGDGPYLHVELEYRIRANHHRDTLNFIVSLAAEES